MNKKITSFLASAAMLCGINANAGFYVAYEQDFDAATSIIVFPEIKSNAALNLCRLYNYESKNDCFDLDLGSSDARSAHFWWGTKPWERVEQLNNGKDNYKIQMKLNLRQGNDTKKEQRNMNFVIVSDEEEVTESNASFNYLKEKIGHQIFSMALLADSVYDYGDTYIQKNTPKFAVMGDTLNAITISASTWYNLELTINSETRNVTWSLTDPYNESSESFKGSYSLPDNVSYKATGIYMLANRYNSDIMMDDIIVGKYVEQELPVAPKIKLIDIGNKYCEFKYTFRSNESLHYEITGCSEGSVFDSYGEYELPLKGERTYSDISHSQNSMLFAENCHAKFWTSLENGEISDPVELDIEIKEYKLPEPSVETISVTEGYGKTYQINFDESTVPFNTRYIDFEYIFTPANGSNAIEGSISSYGGGDKKISFDKSGTLKVRSTRDGSTPSDWVVIHNNTPYKIVKSLDFEHMSVDFLEERGFVWFESIDANMRPQGHPSWTARQRIYDYIGVDMSKKYDPDVEYADETSRIKAEKEWEEELEAKKVALTKAEIYAYGTVKKYHDLEFGDYTDSYYYNVSDSIKAAGFFDNVTLWWSNTKKVHYTIIPRVGLLENGIDMGNNVPVYITDIDDDMYALVYKINEYGRNSIHYFCDTEEEALAKKHGELSHVIKGPGLFQLYRIDSAISCIDFLEACDPAEFPEENTPNDIDNTIKQENTNATIYNLQGQIMRCDRNHLPSGIYIQGNQTFIVK